MNRANRVVQALAGLGVVSLFFPSIVAKANRVVSGDAFPLWDLSPLFAALLLVAWVLLAVSVAGRTGPRVPAWIAIGLTLLHLLIIHMAPGWLDALGVTYSRISLGPHMWIGLFSVAFVLLDLQTRVRNRLFFLMVAAAIVTFAFSPAVQFLSTYLEFLGKRDRFLYEMGRHLMLLGWSVGTATVVGVGIGIGAWRRPILESPLFAFVNGVQTIPSLALFGLLIAPLAFLSMRFPVLRQWGLRGIGFTPAYIALTLYALLPIARNTYLGFAGVDPAVADAARGMGMDTKALFLQIYVPLATPVVLTGIRVAVVQAVGNVVVAALIGAGGLGSFVFQGLGQNAPDLIMLGVLPVLAMAILLDRFFAVIIPLLSPKGIPVQP